MMIERSLTFLWITVLLLFVGCNNENRPAEYHWKEEYNVDLQTVIEGFDGTQSWFQPRVAQTGIDGEYSLIMQSWFISISDYLGTYHKSTHMMEERVGAPLFL